VYGCTPVGGIAVKQTAHKSGSVRRVVAVYGTTYHRALVALKNAIGENGSGSGIKARNGYTAPTAVSSVGYVIGYGAVLKVGRTRLYEHATGKKACAISIFYHKSAYQYLGSELIGFENKAAVVGCHFGVTYIPAEYRNVGERVAGLGSGFVAHETAQ
jgi:hypothetical protein